MADKEKINPSKLTNFLTNFLDADATPPGNIADAKGQTYPTPKSVIDKMFEEDASDIRETMESMSNLAEHIAIEDDEIKAMEDEVTRRKQALDESKVTMYELMMANNCANGHKFDNGILIKPELKETIFKGKKVDDNTLFAWLREQELGAIIKETVHWLTLSGTMKDYRDQGNDLPEIFNPVLKKTTAFAGPGKKNFLVRREVADHQKRKELYLDQH